MYATELITLLIGVLFNGAVTYGVIKTTLKFLEINTAFAQKTADRAHQRIDEILISRSIDEVKHNEH